MTDKARPKKRQWRKQELVRRIPLDREDMELRIFRMTWMDHSLCYEIVKYCKQPNTGTWTRMWPAQQYIQLSIGIASEKLQEIADAVKEVI